jgi:hypothetical protein
MNAAANHQATRSNQVIGSQRIERPANRDERIAEAVGEFLAAAETGTADRAALLTKYNDVAEELAGCLEALDFMNNVAPQLADEATRGATAGLSSSVSPSPHLAATLGDFRIVREIGRGGMGVVYEAEQLSLGRRVALKVLPFAAMLDRQQLSRFKNEARAAATLDHPNIVAIHSVGCERGVHYYAMQLIEGQSLAQVVDQLRRSLPLPLGEGRGEGHRGDAQRGARSEERGARSSRGLSQFCGVREATR